MGEKKLFSFRKQDSKTMHTFRILLGILCMALPFTSVIPGFIAYEKNGPEFWYSISATFYATSNVHMIALLKCTSIFFLCYFGYDWFDRILTLIMALAANFIVDFPCDCLVAEDLVGPWQIPVSTSNIIHCVSAGVLFGAFYVFIRFGFTRGDKNNVSSEKMVRDAIYVMCARLILAGMISQIITSTLGIGQMTIFNETVMLEAFGFAWLVKGGAFRSLNDKKMVQRFS